MRLRQSLTLVICLFIVLPMVVSACNMPAPAKPTQTAAAPNITSTPAATNTTPPTDTPPLPPTFTPTDTPLPPTATLTPTLIPSITLPSGVYVRIRNWTEENINLYRIGRSGETHFLGWVAPRYYGEFRFPDFGEWKIRWCYRDKNGNSYDCKIKRIIVKRNYQEFPIP